MKGYGYLAPEHIKPKAYKRVSEIACVGKKALRLQDWATLGELMNKDHAIQRELSESGKSTEG